MVVLEHLVTSALLGFMALCDGPPSHNGLFIAPRGMRQDPPRPASTLETFIVDESVHLLQDWLQILCEIEIKFELLLLRMNFENNREHLDRLHLSEFPPLEKRRPSTTPLSTVRNSRT